MINFEKLKEIVEAYKDNFTEDWWKKEEFKWIAVKHFQDNWDLNAENFKEMFWEATEKTFNLLAASHNFPRKMIYEFASADPEATRAMFINLYDETKDLLERVEQFESEAERLRMKYDEGSWKQSYQNSNSISTYLWLRYPDQYYIYKYSINRELAKELNTDLIPKKGALDNLTKSYKLYNEIAEYLKKESKLIELLKSRLTAIHYPDEELKTLAIDVGYYFKYVYLKEKETIWFPQDYNPNISVDTWLELLADETVFYPSSLEIMKRMKDSDGKATCTQLAEKYGEKKNYYNSGSSSLARRVAQKTGCPVIESDSDEPIWWPILYLGRKAEKKVSGSNVWKLRDELSEALDKFDLSNVHLNSEPEGIVKNRKYWWLAANPEIWSYSGIVIDETESYTLYNERGNKRRIFQNFLDAKAGDLVIGYEGSPVKQVVALAEIVQENDGENLYFTKTEDLISPIDYSALKDSSELSEMEYFRSPQGSLFKVKEDEFNFIMDLVREENPIKPIKTLEGYSKEKFLEEVFMTSEKLETLISLLENKKNLILQGAPGVGKTFAAKRLAYAMMGKVDDSRIEFIQFHQNYSYEDFIMGYKPKGESFELEKGIFYKFCKKASNQPGSPFFFIIDEINRANMSKVFGELLMLIEKDYRGTKATLAYNGEPFTVPKNVYIIGMMNTADRSLAMIDYALRRRFSFFDMEPGFTSQGFQAYQKGLENDSLDLLIDRVKELNREIATDGSLGKGFRIGHSYFSGQVNCSEEWLAEVVEYDILPMLGEYWFDEPTKLQRWENNLRGVLND